MGSYRKLRHMNCERRLHFEWLEVRRMMTTVVTGDFNGDGFGDLAFGVPEEHVAGMASAGEVRVFYGPDPRSGLMDVNDQIWHQNSPGIEDDAEPGDRFGSSLTVGDFNGDGFPDLAIGIPREDFGAIRDAGAISLLYGSSEGLTGIGDQLLHQNAPGIPGRPESFDHFGSALTGGDFNGDSRDDLAIGVPDENIGSVAGAGAVNELSGTSTGLTISGNQLFHQNASGIRGRSEPFDRFGSALTAGDFDGNGRDDLSACGKKTQPTRKSLMLLRLLQLGDTGYRPVDGPELIRDVARFAPNPYSNQL